MLSAPEPSGLLNISTKYTGLKSKTKTNYLVEEGRELADKELEKVIAGASRGFFLDWAAEQTNLHRKEQYDKQTNEEPARPGND